MRPGCVLLLAEAGSIVDNYKINYLFCIIFVPISELYEYFPLLPLLSLENTHHQQEVMSVFICSVLEI